MSNTAQKKPTLATLKSFVRKNADNLLLRVVSSFDGMTDSVEGNPNGKFNPIQQYANGVFASKEINSNTLGIRGVWLVGSSRDYISTYSQDGLIGYEVYNSCGKFILAIDLKAIDAETDAMIDAARAGMLGSYRKAA